MSLIIRDETISRRLIEQRRASGLDQHDEVWDGVYVMSPVADNEHQDLVGQLTGILLQAVGWPGLGRVLPGANVSDRRDDWTKNFRVPDIAVFLNGSAAEDHATHWLGGPDFAVEIVSRGDHTLDKLDFYAQVGTSELLVIDRVPWQLCLYRRTQAGSMDRVAVCGKEEPETVPSEVLPLAFRIDFLASCLGITHADARPLHDIPIRLGSV